MAESELADLYDAGADDVMFASCASPCSRRACRCWRGVSIQARAAGGCAEVGPYVIDVVARRLNLNGQPVKLSSREFDLALYLFPMSVAWSAGRRWRRRSGGRELGVDSKTVELHLPPAVKLRLQPENGLQLASVYAQGFRLIQVVTLS